MKPSLFTTRKVDGDTFHIGIVSVDGGHITVIKNGKQEMTFTPEQAKKVGAALLAEGAIQDWKSK